MAQYKKDRHAFKYRVIFSSLQNVDLPNGMTVQKPVELFKRWAAIHNASANYIQTLEGFDRRKDLVIAVNATYKDPITFDMDTDAMTVTVNGHDYFIRVVDADEQADLDGFHLIYLRKKEYQTDSGGV